MGGEGGPWWVRALSAGPSADHCPLTRGAPRGRPGPPPRRLRPSGVDSATLVAAPLPPSQFGLVAPDVPLHATDEVRPGPRLTAGLDADVDLADPRVGRQPFEVGLRRDQPSAQRVGRLARESPNGDRVQLDERPEQVRYLSSGDPGLQQ